MLQLKLQMRLYWLVVKECLALGHPITILRISNIPSTSSNWNVKREWLTQRIANLNSWTKNWIMVEGNISLSMCLTLGSLALKKKEKKKLNRTEPWRFNVCTLLVLVPFLLICRIKISTLKNVLILNLQPKLVAKSRHYFYQDSKIHLYWWKKMHVIKNMMIQIHICSNILLSPNTLRKRMKHMP